MSDEVVQDMKTYFDGWVAQIIRLHDRHGREIKWSEMARLRWETPTYGIVRCNRVRGREVVTYWIPFAEEGEPDGPTFETWVKHGDDIAYRRNWPRTEFEAVRLHYMTLGELLFTLDAPLSEVRGWLEITE